MDGRKVYLWEWYDTLKKAIELNTSMIDYIYSEESAEKYKYRNEKLLEKLDKYKKVDENGNIYLYFFSSELEDFMWVLLENMLGNTIRGKNAKLDN